MIVEIQVKQIPGASNFKNPCLWVQTDSLSLLDSILGRVSVQILAKSLLPFSEDIVDASEIDFILPDQAEQFVRHVSGYMGSSAEDAIIDVVDGNVVRWSNDLCCGVMAENAQGWINHLLGELSPPIEHR